MSSRNLAVLSILSVGAFALSACSTEELESSSAIGNTESSLIQIQGSSCSALLAGQTISAGTVCSSIEGENLKVTYATSNGWLLDETHLWAGLNLADMPQTKNGNPKIGNFPYNSGPLGGVSSYSVLVPLSVFGLSSSMTVCDPKTAYLVTHAVVKKQLADGTFQSETAYGEGPRLVQKGNWAMWFSLTLTCAKDPEPPVAGTCETAFAFGGSAAKCFINSGLVDTNRWGWFNGPFGPGSYSLDIYAGAGKCDLNKGTKVGTLSIVYDGFSAKVTYSMLSGFTMDETHLYVGSEPLARDVNGEYTVAPGQYPQIHSLKSASSDSFTVSGLSGSIYVVAHSVACSSNWP